MAAPLPNVYVVGVGMTKFEKPGTREHFDYPQMATEAITNALQDAHIPHTEIQQACVGYVYGESTSGQRALYEAGIYGIPVYNINNNCATGSTALLMAKQILESGNAQCVLALGFEKMEKGSLTSKFDDRTNPMDRHVEQMGNMVGVSSAPITAQLFGNAGKEHMDKFGTRPEHFAKIAHKNHKHSTNNPYSQFQEEYTLQQIMNSPQVFGPLTKLQCCPTSDGSAAAILCTEVFVNAHNLQDQAVLIVGMVMATDPPSTFTSKSMISLVGYDMTRIAADQLFLKTPYKPTDVDVVELHDCFSVNELITYEALGLCPPGKAAEFVDSGNNTYGGRHVVNPSGGLISKGHPLGATGIAQCAELCWQLRGLAGLRQVPNARLALQHNIGLGGAVVVALYKLGYPRYLGGRFSHIPATPTTEASSLSTVTTVSGNLEEVQEGMIGNVKRIYGFKVTISPEKEVLGTFNANTELWKVECDGQHKADVTSVFNYDDLTGLFSDNFNAPQQAFFRGNIKMMDSALKITDLQKRTATITKQLQCKL